jgi:hypothetical protein
LRSLEEQRDAIVIEKEDLAMSYYKLRQQLDKLGSEMQKFIVKPKYILPFLQPGRLVKVRSLYMQSQCSVWYSVFAPRWRVQMMTLVGVVW